MDFKLWAKEKVDCYNATDSLIILFQFGINQWRTIQTNASKWYAVQVCDATMPP